MRIHVHVSNQRLLCSFGVIPTTPLPIHTPLMPNQNIDISLPLNTIGPVMKMDPLNNLQVGTWDRQRSSFST